ncbi:VOC family protein [Arthrobacter sp. zg-Y877]|uniref:VOC family protein n=1 Tax=Arthrobacter sp. zg-Y877 TaxID=3049074 RepID=UPI0025A4BB16|nr:VOC family protein [Arthrobacter sp. zg-Y877]MDM7990658.1 VOC family protein [Arthrobacter sp. zg-Y877]
MRLHHVQVSIPKGGEDQARRFYGEGLGLTEVAKPPSLAGRGGCWFRAFDADTVAAEIHLGVDSPFIPAQKAHPALVLESSDALVELGARLSLEGYEVSWADRYTFEGYERFHCRDPFGNRVEILSPPAD